MDTDTRAYKEQVYYDLKERINGKSPDSTRVEFMKLAKELWLLSDKEAYQSLKEAMYINNKQFAKKKPVPVVK